MINIDDLKPILEPLLEGREDAATVIEALSAIDVDAEDNAAATEAAVTAAVAAKDSEWQDRYRRSFFSPEPSAIATDAAASAGTTTTTTVDDTTPDPEDIDFDDILKEES